MMANRPDFPCQPKRTCSVMLLASLWQIKGIKTQVLFRPLDTKGAPEHSADPDVPGSKSGKALEVVVINAARSMADFVGWD